MVVIHQEKCCARQTRRRQQLEYSSSPASERFSWWLTKLLHVFPDDDAFETRIKLSEFDHLLRSNHAAAMVAEQYAGLPFES